MGYNVYIGTSSGTYPFVVDVGNVLTYTVPDLTEGVTYYFALTAYDTSRNESPFSDEVHKTITTTGGGGSGSGSSGSGCGTLRMIFGKADAKRGHVSLDLAVPSLMAFLAGIRLFLKRRGSGGTRRF